MFTIIWWVSGAGGWLFWWSKDHNVTANQMVACVIGGLLTGPLSWGLGSFFSKPKPPTTIIKRWN